MDKLVDSDPKDFRSRDVCYLMIRLSEEFVGQLSQFIDTGNGIVAKRTADGTIDKLSKGVLK